MFREFQSISIQLNIILIFSSGTLKKHMITHTGEKAHVCDECGNRFTTGFSLIKHKRIHSGERPYPCDYCPKRFISLFILQNHVRTHTGNNRKIYLKKQYSGYYYYYYYYSFRWKTIPMSVLHPSLCPKIGHDKTHKNTHWRITLRLHNLWTSLQTTISIENTRKDSRTNITFAASRCCCSSRTLIKRTHEIKMIYN